MVHIRKDIWIDIYCQLPEIPAMPNAYKTEWKLVLFMA